MAELTTMRNDVLGYPIYGLPYVVAFPILDVDGDPVTGLTPDTEVSLNGDTGADTATEAAEITFTTATNKGMYQLQLSAAEMTANVVAITVYTGSADAQATPIVLYPKQLPLIASGVAGADGDDTTHIDLHGLSAINDFYNGCIVFLKDHTGANQVRMITDYVGATCLATVAPAFATAPDNTTDYEIYMTDVALTTLLVSGIGAGGIAAASFAAGAIDAAAIKDGAIDNATFAADVGSTAGATNIIALAVDKSLELAKVPKSDAAVTWNATALASIQTEANDALIANNLDHLMKTPVADITKLGDGGGNEVPDSTVLSLMLCKGTDTDTYNHTTDSLESIRDKETDIETDTAVIGALGAGLTGIPWNATWDAEVQSEVDDALKALELDHLCVTATGAADMTTEVADNTVLSRIIANGDTSTFVQATDGLRPIATDVAATHVHAAAASAPTAAQVADAVWDEVLHTDHEVATSASVLLQSAGGAADPWATDLPGAYAGTTAGHIIGHLGAPAGASIAADIADLHTDIGTAITAIGDVHATDLPAVMTMLTDIHGTDLPDLHTDVGTAIADIAAVHVHAGTIEADVAAVHTHVGDIHDTDLPAVKADTAAILVDTGTTLDTDIQSVLSNQVVIDGKLPAALVGGKMDSLAALKKNTALAKFAFVMTDSVNHAPIAAIAPTCTRSIDGGAFGAGTLANIVEQADAVGVYLVDFGAGDLNGAVIVLRATGAGCDDTFVTLVTCP